MVKAARQGFTLPGSNPGALISSLTKVLQKKPGDPGLWDNIRAKRERIEKLNDKMRKPEAKDASTAKALQDSQPKKSKWIAVIIFLN